MHELGIVTHVAKTVEQIALENDITDAALTYSGILSASGVDAVHHHACHRFHSILPLAACLTLNQTCQQLPVRKCHS